MYSQTSNNFPLRVATSAFALALFCASATPAAAQFYTVFRAVSDTPAGGGAIIDPNLVNPWGLAALPGSPWWVSDNGTGLSTLYDGTGHVQSLVVTVPPSASAPPGSSGRPTGIVANTTTDFGGAKFIFDTEDGTISAWSGGSSAVIKVDKGSAAVYKGLALGQMGTVNVLYAANFTGKAIEAYDTNFNPVTLASGAFNDPQLPTGLGPFNVQVINGEVYVAFAQVDPASGDEVAGPGRGFVDKFDTDGHLLMRFQYGLFLNAPWGIALAPANFGAFSNDLLIGNFGSGMVIAYDAATGRAKGALRDSAGKLILIPGLWALTFGLGGASGPTNFLFFTAGIQDEAHGAFGYFVSH
jgi:uncharacterized protein (TIGR03118 family)